MRQRGTSIGLVFSVAGALCFVSDFAAFAPALVLFTPTGGLMSVFALNACRHRKARDWIIPVIGTVLSLGAILVIILTILGVAVTFATVATD